MNRHPPNAGKGRKKGVLNKTTEAARALLDGEAETITRKCIEMAKEGHPIALKLVMERMVPPTKIIDIQGGMRVDFNIFMPTSLESNVIEVIEDTRKEIE